MRALRDYAEKNGYAIARQYVDEAESGRIADRPQFRKMIDEGSKATSPFQVILIRKTQQQRKTSPLVDSGLGTLHDLPKAMSPADEPEQGEARTFLRGVGS